MTFAYPFPGWLWLVVVAAAGALAFLEYRRPLSPLTLARRTVLVSLRVATLAIIATFLFRPTMALPPSGIHDAVVPVLVDVSRSMRLADGDDKPGEQTAAQTRLERATALLKTELLPALSRQYATELYTIGDALTPAMFGQWSPNAGRSNLVGALDEVRQRYRGRRVAGIVLLSDGGDTGGRTGRTQEAQSTAQSADGPPIFAIGIGATGGLRDREILGLTAGEQRLDQASIDLHVTALTNGFGRAPFELRLLSNGHVVDTRRITPQVEHSPIDETFTVSPDPQTPTVYSVAIPPGDRETVTENNTRGVLVSPSGRTRRLLVIEGAPGFEHTFMKRAWTIDPGFDVDSVVRKGKNGDGRDTFLVQAAAGRSAALTSGFPARREDLFGYDALVLANVDGDSFTSAQLAMVRDFVADRGGGLLVVGGRSFAPRGLAGTVLEEVLPVDLSDRDGSVPRATSGAGLSAGFGPGFEGGHGPPANTLAVTADGERHPVMRIGDSAEDARARWAALPALASIVTVGGPRPGATVLAVTTGPNGGVYPVIAVQRYGQGRSMIFAGEASWRWRMMLPSTNRTHEFFWRQTARWLAMAAPDPVTISVPESVEPGDVVTVIVDARDGAFAPVQNAVLDASLTLPGGEVQPLTFGRGDGGRFTTTVNPEHAGLYLIHVEAHDSSGGGATGIVGTADRWMYVGGTDREFVDPRLNQDLLRRLARRSGGGYFPSSDAASIVSLLQSTTLQTAAERRRDLWHEPWAFALVVGLLSGEWILRRRWGLR